TRRQFCTAAALLSLQPRLLRAQSSTHIDVAAVERDRVLADAAIALTQPVRTIATLHSPATDPHDFYSEADTPGAPKPFRTHAEALLDLAAAVSTLTAAFVISHDERFALRAGNHLFAWFVDPATRMNPNLQNAFATAQSVNAL